MPSKEDVQEDGVPKDEPRHPVGAPHAALHQLARQAALTEGFPDAGQVGLEALHVTVVVVGDEALVAKSAQEGATRDPIVDGCLSEKTC